MYLSSAYAQTARVTRRRRAAVGLGTALLLSLGPVAGAQAARPTPARSVPRAASRGTVDVLSAGSLNSVMTKKIAPAFHAATGYTLVDTSGGSSTLASDIKNKVDVADVFISASPKVTGSLMGRRNGSWVLWYASFADSPYVLGYAPKSRFASDLKSKPWYDVVTMPGFRLGRTNPSQDPGGVLAVEVMKQAAAKYKLTALRTLATESSDEYEETAEQAGIQNGQLDAAFMYEADANSQGSPFVRLTGVPTLYGKYTISLVKGQPHRTAALAFIRFLLGSRGRALMKSDGFGVLSPAKVTGADVPPSLKDLFAK